MRCAPASQPARARCMHAVLVAVLHAAPPSRPPLPRSNVTFEDCILECESTLSNAHTLCVQRGARCLVSGSRLYAAQGGHAALKCQSGGTVVLKKRTLVQGGILVTSGGLRPPAAQAAPAAGAAQQEEAQQQPQDAQAEEEWEEGAAAAGAAQQGWSDGKGSSGAAPGGPQDGGGGCSTAQSTVVLRNSEVRLGTVSCVACFGSGSTLQAEGCIIGGATNYGCARAGACAGACLQLQGA